MDVIKVRRSIRYMKPDAIPQEHILDILEAARLAPSWANRQCWRFVVVQDAEKRKALATCGGPPEAMNHAPVTIVACALPQDSGHRYGQDYYLVDMGIAVEHLILEATALGLGTCWVGVFDADRVRAILGIPSEVKVVALIPVGYPSQERPPRPRKSLEEIAFWDAWPDAAPQSSH